MWIAQVELLAQALGETAHGELGRVIRALTGDADDAKDARDVDDVTFARALEVRKKRARAVNHSPEVDVDDALEDLEGAVDGDPGVVKDHVHVTELVGDRGGPGVERLPVSDIEDLRGDARAEALALRGGLGERFFLDIADGQVCAARSELLGERSANTRGCSSDSCDAVLIGLHGSSPCCAPCSISSERASDFYRQTRFNHAHPTGMGEKTELRSMRKSHLDLAEIQGTSIASSRRSMMISGVSSSASAS